MIDPRISLAVRAPDVAPAINIFENALMNAQRRDIAAAQEARQAELQPLRVEQAQRSQDIARNQQRLLNIHQTGQRLKPLLEAGDTDAAQRFLANNILEIQGRAAQGSPENTNDSVEILAKIRQGDIQGALGDINAVAGLVTGGKGQKQFALQSNAPITDPVTGQVSTPVFNPLTGATDLVPIKGAFRETPTEVAERDVSKAQQLSDISISETKEKEKIKKTEARTSALKTEFSERRRLAARSTRKVKEVQKLAQLASQGNLGAAKLKLSRLMPGIDASNEGALSGAFKSLALDELQKFKGPTTDFEFAVTEDIAGSLGSSASANMARLASLERANWFADRESQQFNEHIKAGHDPDDFFFNFNELVTPRKGGKSYSLQSLQDTAVANHISIDEVIKRLSK